MTFEELLALLREPGEDGLPPGIYDDLGNTYSLAVDGANATIADRDATIQALNAEISRLKAMNYDLMVNSPSAPAEPEPDSDDSDDDDSSDSLTIDDLFKEN